MDHFLNKDLKISTLEKISRYEIINFLQKKNDNIGIELGVAKGDFSKKLIENNTFKFFFGVDSYSDFEEDLYGPDSHNEEQYKFALKNIGIRSNYNLLRMDFDNALDLFEDNYFDFIYIDGFASTGQNGGKILVDWFSKLKIGGIFAGDDYHEDFSLNKKVVDDFSIKIKAKLNITGSLKENNNYSQYPSWFLIKEKNVHVETNINYINIAKKEERKLLKFRKGKINLYKRLFKKKLILYLKKINLYYFLKKIYKYFIK